MTGRLFITGMVRSGTTLISRAFDAHPNIVCAPDPCLGFFRSLRNELLYRTYGSCPDPEAPFSDFFFPRRPELAMMFNASFDLPIAFESMETIRERLRLFNLDSNSTCLVPVLKELGSEKNYTELLGSILTLLQQVYGSDKTQWVGFKQTWVEAFAPVFFNTWPDVTCVHVVRDPRAVIASWIGTSDLTHDYPLLMILRHWRKSAALASLFVRQFGDKYNVLRYEDFVRDPEEALRAIFDRMDLPFDPCTTDSIQFRTGAGEQWQANTSYGMTEGISSRYVDKWHERLSGSDLQFIEDMCAPEMRRWNYARTTDPGAPALLLKAPNLSKQIPGEIDWIAHYAHEYAPSPINQAKELYRWHLWNHRDRANSIDLEDSRAIFIDPDLLDQ